MANTTRTYTGNGTTTLYPVDFALGYLSREYVYVYLAGNEYTNQLAYTWIDDTQIELTTAVADGVDFVIRRVVPRSTLINDYDDGAILRERNLDDSFRQALMALEEVADGFAAPDGAFTFNTDVNMLGNKITNLKDALDDGDAVSFAFLRDYIISAGEETGIVVRTAMYVNDDLSEIPTEELSLGAQAYEANTLSDYVWYINPNGSGGQWVPRGSSGAGGLNVFPSQFGIVGDGSDETTAIQAMFDAASGKTVVLDQAATYGINHITIPDDVTLRSYNSKFRKLVADNEYGIRIKERFKADTISLNTIGGSTDYGLRFQGNLCQVGYARCFSETIDSDRGIVIQSTTGFPLGGINIEKITSANFRSSILIFNVGESKFNKITVDTYVTGLYCRDIFNCEFDGILARNLSPSSIGTAGQNGVLVESSTATDSTHDCTFSNVDISDSGEHGFRVGGDLTCRDLSFYNIRTKNTGAAGAAATGGQGFKILMKDATGGYHKNMIIDGVHVEDCSTTGTGIGNFAGVSFGLINGITASNIIVKKGDNTYSAWHGLSIYECLNVKVDNLSATDCRQHALRLEGGLGVFVPNLMQNVSITNAYLENEASVNSAVIKCDTRDTELSRIDISARCRGGLQAVDYDTGTLPTPFVDCTLDIKYSEPLSTVGVPPIVNNNNILVNYKGPFYGSFNMNASDSSIVQDDAGNVRIRKTGAWSTL